MKVYLNCLCLAILFTEIASLLSLPKNLLNLGTTTKSTTTVTTTTTTTTSKPNVLSLQSTLANLAALTSSLSLTLTAPLPDDDDLTSSLTYPLVNDTATDAANTILPSSVLTSPSSTQSLSIPSPTNLLSDVTDLISPLPLPLSINASSLNQGSVLTSPITVPLLEDTVTNVGNLVPTLQAPVVPSNDDSTVPITVPLVEDILTNVGNLVPTLQVPVVSSNDDSTAPIRVPLLEDTLTNVGNLVSNLQAPVVPSNNDSTAPISVSSVKHESVITSPLAVPLLEDTVTDVGHLVATLQVPPSSDTVADAPPNNGQLISPDSDLGSSPDIGVVNQPVHSIVDLPYLGGTYGIISHQNGLGNIYSILSGIPGLGELTGVTNLFSNSLGLVALQLALPAGLSSLFSDIANALSKVDGLNALLIRILAVLSLLLSDISASTQLPLGSIISSIPVLRPVLSGLLQLPGLATGFINGLTGFVPGYGYFSFRVTGLSLTGSGGLTDILNSVLSLLSRILSSIADLLNGLSLASTLSRLPYIGGLLETLLPGINSGSLLPSSVSNTDISGLEGSNGAFSSVGSGWSTYDDLYRYRKAPLIDIHNNEINGIKIVVG